MLGVTVYSAEQTLAAILPHPLESLTPSICSAPTTTTATATWVGVGAAHVHTTPLIDTKMAQSMFSDGADLNCEPHCLVDPPEDPPSSTLDQNDEWKKIIPHMLPQISPTDHGRDEEADLKSMALGIS